MYSNLPPDRLTNRIVMSDASDYFEILTKIPDADKPNEKSKILYHRSKLSSKQWEQFNTELKTVLSQKFSQETCANRNSAADCVMAT